MRDVSRRRNETRKAVEMPGLWKAWKAKSRVPTFPPHAAGPARGGSCAFGGTPEIADAREAAHASGGHTAGCSRRPGKPRQVSDEAIVWMQNLACQKPKDLGYAQELWTYRLLTGHIRRHEDFHHGLLEYCSRGTAPVLEDMLNQKELSPRNAEVLRSIVKEYIETGEPVASRTVSRRQKDNLSPASIRNVMADLAEEGYLSQPHTSAGRLPTEKAFRRFVQELNVRPPSAAEVQRLRLEFMGTGSPKEWMGRSTHVLTELTRNVGIVIAIPAVQQILDRIELVPLPDRRMLIVIVTRDRAVHNRVVALDDEISPADTTSIRNYLNEHFTGWTLSDARRELERRLRYESAYYDALLRRLTCLYSRGLLDIDLDPEVHIEGASYLVGVDLHLTRERLRELFRALGEKKRILHLLDRFLESPPGEVAVQVGLRDLHPAMAELSLIGITVTTPGGLAARVAVLGPMRMRYEKVMAAVWNVGRALQKLPS